MQLLQIKLWVLRLDWRLFREVELPTTRVSDLVAGGFSEIVHGETVPANIWHGSLSLDSITCQRFAARSAAVRVILERLSSKIDPFRN